VAEEALLLRQGGVVLPRGEEVLVEAEEVLPLRSGGELLLVVAILDCENILGVD
jgi:hypothetical protein